MKNKYPIILLLLLLVFGCESPTEPDYAAKDYFPLTIGNRWYYNSGYPDTSSINIIWEVTREQIINNKQYYEIVKQNLGSNYSDTIYYRINGDTLFSKSKYYDELIIADFSLNLGETAYWQSDLTVTQKTEDLIKFETPFGADYGYSVIFKKGIGITNQIINGFILYRIKLVKAEIKIKAF